MRGLVIPILILILLAGCSGKVVPTTPDNPGTLEGISSLPVGVVTVNESGTVSEGMGALGLFSVHFDPGNMTAEITGLRKSSLTDVLETVDITNFLRLAPCTDCVKLRSVSYDSDGHPVLTIGIRHPFGEGDPLKPISGRNRGDLHVFNVEGIVISNTGAESFIGLAESISSLALLNADGYTGYLDEALDGIYPTDATVHPYITHFDDYSAGNFNASNSMGFESVTTPPPTGNLVMAMGCDYDYKDYVFDIDDPVDFIYAVGCTYAVSAASKIQRFTPEYRIPQHNKKAASEVTVTILDNRFNGGDMESDADIEVKVVDISHGVNVGTGLDQMLADSSVGNIYIEIAGVTASPVMISGSSASGGSGHDPSDPLVYTATVTNSAGAPEGMYRGLVKVSDAYAPGQNTSPLLSGMDGIKRVDPTSNPLTGLFAIDEFATYQAFEIEILNQNVNPVADAVIATQAYIAPFAAITIDATGSYDPDGTIESYEWDFNNDGTFGGFGDEYTGNAWSPVHNFPVGSCQLIQLRVTDNRNATDELDTPLNVCPFKNIILRPGFSVSDVGTIEDTNDVLIMFEDHQVWKYSCDFMVAALLYTMPNAGNTIAQRLEASSNGDSCCGWWDANQYMWYSYYTNGTLANAHTFTWPDPPHNFDLCVTYSTLWVPPGLHNLIGMFYDVSGMDAWFRSGYAPPDYYSYYGNYNTNIGPGPQRIDINYLKGMAASRLPATSYNMFYLEGDPEWRVERSYILIGFNGGWGGTQTDADSGFWDPRDITLDQYDHVFVTDVLSTGDRRIKEFDTNGNPFGAFGDNVTMAVDPQRIDASFASDWLYVTMDEGISIFFPSEH
jgi:hypothetical protein